MNNDQITALLQELTDGNREVVDRLVPEVYGALREIAHRQLSREKSMQTLNTTALVHEAYLKLIKQDRVTWKNRAHFYGVAAISMRRILVNYARDRRAEKRGGKWKAVTLKDDLVERHTKVEDLISLDQALEKLAEMNDRQSKVVTCRFFGGLSLEETAEALGVSVPTVHRDWRIARAWLARQLSDVEGIEKDSKP